MDLAGFHREIYAIYRLMPGKALWMLVILTAF